MIAVDIGGTNLLVGLIEGNTVTERSHQPVMAGTEFEAVTDQVCEAIQELHDGVPEAVGISVAGSVDAKDGIVLRAQNLNWDNAPLAQVIANKLRCKVVIENDVTSAAWGEFKFGAGKGTESMFAVWIGTGIGGGLILNGEIWRGPLGTAGEFGMAISEFDSTIERRELEAFASRSGVQRITGLPTLDTDSIINAYQSKAGKTYDAISAGALRIGTGIANVITLLSLDTVVLGGGIIEALGTSYIEQIREQFDRDVFPKCCCACVFKQTELGPDAGLLGVADLASRS